jgi:hypothetical protein
LLRILSFIERLFMKAHDAPLRLTPAWPRTPGSDRLFWVAPNDAIFVMFHLLGNAELNASGLYEGRLHHGRDSDGHQADLSAYYCDVRFREAEMQTFATGMGAIRRTFTVWPGLLDEAGRRARRLDFGGF